MTFQSTSDVHNEPDRILDDTDRRIRDSQAAHWSAHDIFDNLGRATMLTTIF